MSEHTVSAMENDDDAARLGEILTQCFHAPADFWPGYVRRIGRECFRVVRRERRVEGGLAILPMGQWFGGSRISMAGIAAVGVAPEARGAGAAAALMATVVRELRNSGFAISVLFSAAQALYRSVGYEIAGNHVVYEVPAAAIGLRDRDLPVRSIDPVLALEIRELHRQRAMREAGHLDRSPPIWEQIVTTREGRVLGYVAGPEDRPEGYVLFKQEPPRFTGDYDLAVRDLVALTPTAGRRLLSLLADHRSQAGRVRWVGPATEPLLALFPEPVHEIRATTAWHLRVLDVAAALGSRGYPESAAAEIHLDVRDTLLEENAGRWILRVENGRGSVEPGGRGDLALDVRGLAPLLTGHLPARALARVGLVAGADDALVGAETVFAGPEPWLPEHF